MIVNIPEYVFFENRINNKYKCILGTTDYTGRNCYEYQIGENVTIGIVSYMNHAPIIRNYGVVVIAVNNEVSFLSNDGEILSQIIVGSEIYDIFQIGNDIIVLSDIECVVLNNALETKTVVDFEDVLINFEFKGKYLICYLENGTKVKVDLKN